jgi:hypothetical protein
VLLAHGEPKEGALFEPTTENDGLPARPHVSGIIMDRFVLVRVPQCKVRGGSLASTPGPHARW